MSIVGIIKEIYLFYYFTISSSSLDCEFAVPAVHTKIHIEETNYFNR